MAGSDASRADLFVRLEQSVGRETAAALMDHIPPEGWPEFATKSDLALIEERLGRQIEAVDHHVELVEHRLLAEVDRRLRAHTWVHTSTLIAGLALVAAIGRIG